MDALAFAPVLAATLNAGTVLAFAALGLLINERAGIVNLGAEGIMLVAAIAGFATAFTPAATGSPSAPARRPVRCSPRSSARS
jgi:ABC-type uncharacterized transport system permease subunit